MNPQQLSNDLPSRPVTDSLELGVEIHTVIQLNRLGELLSRPFLQTFAEDHDISLTECRVMLILADTPGLASQDVAETTGIHPMNISRAVTKLRKLQYLDMVKDPIDHRRRLLYMTDAGWKVYHQFFPAAQHGATQLFSVLNSQEMKNFTEYLVRLGIQAEQLIGSQTHENQE